MPPFGTALESPFDKYRTKKRSSKATGFSPDEQESLLDSLGHASLSGLNYVGGMLDKFTGARAVRGLLGGKPREVLSVLPGSDTFGITNKADDVTGKQLMNWDDPNTWVDDIAGFGVEALLDPTLLIGGPVVKGAGKAMKAAGMLAKAESLGKAAGMGKRLTALTHTPRMVLNAGKELPLGKYDKFVASVLKPKQGGKGLESAGLLTSAGAKLDTGITEFDQFAKAAKNTGSDPFSILDNPIHESLASLKLPFMEPFAAIGKGKQALRTAGVLDAAGKVISAPLEGFQSHIDQKAEDAFRKDLRASSPSHITDEMLDSDMAMLKTIAEGYHGKTLGNFIRSKGIKASDVLPGGGSTMYQGQPAWKSKAVEVIRQKVRQKVSEDDLTKLLKGAGVKDDEIKAAKLNDLYKNSGEKTLDKDNVLKWLDVNELDNRLETIVLTRGNPNPKLRTLWGPAFEEQHPNFKTRTKYPGSDPDSYKELLFKDRASNYNERHWGANSEGVVSHARGEDVIVNGKKKWGVHEIQSKVAETARAEFDINKDREFRSFVKDATDSLEFILDQKLNFDTAAKSPANNALKSLREVAASGKIDNHKARDLFGDVEETYLVLGEEYKELSQKSFDLSEKLADRDISPQVAEAIRAEQESVNALMDDVDRMQNLIAYSNGEAAVFKKKAIDRIRASRQSFTKGDQWMTTTARGLLRHLVENGYDGVILPASKDVPTVTSSNRPDTLAKLYDEIFPKVMEKEVRKYGGKLQKSEKPNTKLEWKQASRQPSVDEEIIQKLSANYDLYVKQLNDDLRRYSGDLPEGATAERYRLIQDRLAKIVDDGHAGDYYDAVEYLNNDDKAIYEAINKIAESDEHVNYALLYFDELDGRKAEWESKGTDVPELHHDPGGEWLYVAYSDGPGEWTVIGENKHTGTNKYLGDIDVNNGEDLELALSRVVNEESPLATANTIDFNDEIKKGFSEPQYMWQGGAASPKGATTFMPDESIVLSTFKSADASTHLHEFMHIASKFLTDQDRAIVNKFLGHAGDTDWAKWSVDDHEKLATGFEKFWLKGHAPEGALAKVWGKIQSWMKAVYDTLTKQGKLADVTPEIDDLYKRLMRGRPEHLRGNLLEGMSPAVARAAKALDKAGEFARWNRASRGAAQLFDANSMGMKDRWAQDMARKMTEKTAEARQEALVPFSEAINKLRTEKLLDNPDATRSAFQQLEGYEPFSGPMGETNRKLRAAKIALHERAKLVGAAPRELQDEMMPYHWHRQADMEKNFADVDLEGEPLLKKHDPARKDFLKGIDKGSATIEYDLARNPSFVGQKIAKGGSALDTPKEIFNALRSKKYRHFFPGLNLAGTDPEGFKLAENRLKKLSKWLHKLKPEIQQKGFLKHPYEAGRNNVVKTAERTARAEVMIDTLAEQMKPFLKQALSADEKGHSVNQILVHLNLKKPLGKNGMVHDDAAVARLGELLGVHDPRNELTDQIASGAKTLEEAEADLQKWRNSIGKVRLPKDMAQQFTRVAKFYKAPKEASKIFKALDSYTNLFKTSVLTWPARYVRDFFSGQVQNFFLGAFSAKTVADVDRFLKGKQVRLDRLIDIPAIREMLDERKLPHTVENANEMLRVHVASMEMFGERVAQGAQIGSPSTQRGVKAIANAMPGVQPLSLKEAGKELTNVQGAKDWWKNAKAKNWSTWGVRGVGDATEHTMPLVRAGNTTGVYIDALNRLPAYLELLRKGDSPAVAKAKVMAAHVDYSNRALTTTERQVMTKAFPFYRFSRHAAEYTVKELFKNPSGRMAQVVRGGNRAQSRSEEGEIVPEHIARTLALPIPEGIPGVSGPEGSTRYLTGLGLMHEDSLGLFQPGSSAYHGAKGTLQSLVGRANPIIKAPLEVAFGKQAFSGRDLEDLDPNVGRIMANVMGQDTPVQTPILMEHALANSPAARALSSARTVSDTRPNATLKALLNLGTGVRLTDMDKEKAKNLAHRKLLEEYLRGNPNIHRFEHLFSGDDSKLSDREKAIMELYRQFSRESAKAARRRDQSGR